MNKSKIISKAEIESIVQKNMYDLGYKKKFSKDYYIDLVNSVFKDLESNDKSHSGKPYLSALPHDLRTNDLDKLQERIDAIDERMDELNEEHFQLGADEESLQNIINNFNKSDTDLQNEAFDSISSIQDRFHEELKGYDLGKASVDGKPNTVYLEINSLNELFEHSGTITGMEADTIMDIAGQIVDFAYEQTDGDDTPWSNRVIGIADDLRALAMKHNVNNNNQGNELEEFFNISSTLENLYAEDRKNRRLYNDYKSERIRTQDRIKEVKKGKRN